MISAAQPTLVVKMSDTSHHGKAGSTPAFDVSDHIPLMPGRGNTGQESSINL
jgi:hypothetical protein